MSFYATPQWGAANNGGIASTYTMIASLSSFRIELYQARLWTFDSLISFKYRQSDSFTNNGDKTFWTQVPLISVAAGVSDATGAGSLAALWEVMPFSTVLNLVPAATGVHEPSAQQFWTRLESSSRLVVDFRGGGQGATVQGFARFRYVPIRGR